MVKWLKTATLALNFLSPALNCQLIFRPSPLRKKQSNNNKKQNNNYATQSPLEITSSEDVHISSLARINCISSYFQLYYSQTLQYNVSKNIAHHQTSKKNKTINTINHGIQTSKNNGSCHTVSCKP